MPCRKSVDGAAQVIVPELSFPQSLQLADDEPLAGHNGVQKTLERVLQRFWWPAVNRDVAQYTQSCTVCAARTSAGRNPRACLQERPRPDRPFCALEMDIK